MLVLLSRLPRLVVLIGILALVVAGLFVPGIPGAVLLMLVAVILGWLLTVAWPALSPSQRAPRLLTVGLLVGYAVWKSTR